MSDNETRRPPDPHDVVHPSNLTAAAAQREADAMLAELDDGEPATKYAPAPHGIPAVIDTTVHGERITAEVVIAGRPVDLLAKPPSCAHLSFTQQVVVANLVDEHTQAHVAWRVQIKVRCAECGVSFRFKRKSSEGTFGAPDAATSDDGLTLGAIIEPIPEDDEPAPWPAIGEPKQAGEWPVVNTLRHVTGS